MKINIEFSTKELKLIQKYAQKKDLSIEEFIKDTVIESIEKIYDFEIMQKVYKDLKDNPHTYDKEEAKKLLSKASAFDEID